MKNIAIIAAMVLATATGANADAFGKCGAKIAAAEIAEKHGVGPAGEAILMALESTRGVERNMTEIGKSIKKLNDLGMEFSQIEYEMMQVGVDPDVMRIARLCLNEL